MLSRGGVVCWALRLHVQRCVVGMAQQCHELFRCTACSHARCRRCGDDTHVDAAAGTHAQGSVAHIAARWSSGIGGRSGCHPCRWRRYSLYRSEAGSVGQLQATHQHRAGRQAGRPVSCWRDVGNRVVGERARGSTWVSAWRGLALEVSSAVGDATSRLLAFRHSVEPAATYGPRLSPRTCSAQQAAVQGLARPSPAGTHTSIMYTPSTMHRRSHVS